MVTACIAYTCMYTTQVQVLLDAIWKNPYVKHESCEPIVSALCFFGFGGLFNALSGYYRPAFALQVAKRDWSMVTTGGAYLVILLVFDLFYPRHRSATYPVAPTVTRLVCECVTSVVMYDFAFFWLHLAMHRIHGLYRFHRRHHQYGGDIDVHDVLRHGFVDASLQVLVNVAVLNLLQLHPLSRRFHNVIVIYMLSESHSGLDLSFMLHRIVPFSLYGGAPHHHLHHKFGDRHYHQFFKYLDSAFDTVKPSTKFQVRSL
jgi:sterol desaturase/sphingolipid hydroxylase (fatty acid hydroxylase superfamily)